MTTAATLIDEALEHVTSGANPEKNTLASGIDADDTMLTFTYDLNGIQAGVRIAIGLELCDVVATSTGSATVIRGVGGSTAAAHSSGVTVTVQPVFSRFAVFRELNNELASLSAKGLFAVKTVDLTWSPAYQGYDMTSVTAVLKLLEVRAEQHGGQKAWDTVPLKDVQLQRNADTGEFASGFSLQVTGSRPQSGRTLRVVYAAPFGSLSSESTDPNAAAVGLPSTANDIPPMGAALRLTAFREVPRNQFESQGEPRRGSEVPPGAQVTAVRMLKALYDERVSDEANRLLRFYPTRRHA